MTTDKQNDISFRIADKIRRIRELKGLKQDSVAKRMGITTNGYGKIERGESSITLDRLEQIAQVLEVSTLDILQFDDHFVYNINTMNNSATNGIVYNYSFSEEERNMLKEQIDRMQQLIDSQNAIIRLFAADKTNPVKKTKQP
jgi:transcriptional regulator with XRE-family HTH domain